MAKVRGKALIVSKGADTVLGAVNVTLTDDSPLMEIETLGSYGPERDYGGESATANISGAVDDADTAVKAILNAKYAGTKLTDISIVFGFGTWSGNWVVESFEVSAEPTAFQQFTAVLKSDNGYTYVAA